MHSLIPDYRKKYNIPKHFSNFHEAYSTLGDPYSFLIKVKRFDDPYLQCMLNSSSI